MRGCLIFHLSQDTWPSRAHAGSSSSGYLERARKNKAKMPPLRLQFRILSAHKGCLSCHTPQWSGVPFIYRHACSFSLEAGLHRDPSTWRPRGFGCPHIPPSVATISDCPSNAQRPPTRVLPTCPAAEPWWTRVLLSSGSEGAHSRSLPARERGKRGRPAAPKGHTHSNGPAKSSFLLRRLNLLSFPLPHPGPAWVQHRRVSAGGCPTR